MAHQAHCPIDSKTSLSGTTLRWEKKYSVWAGMRGEALPYLEYRTKTANIRQASDVLSADGRSLALFENNAEGEREQRLRFREKPAQLGLEHPTGFISVRRLSQLYHVSRPVLAGYGDT